MNRIGSIPNSFLPPPTACTLLIRRSNPAPWSPNVKEPPVLACDHPIGQADGHDRPHMLDDVLDPSRLHKCIADYDRQIKDGIRR